MDFSALPESLKPLLFAFLPCFTKPSQKHFLALTIGWIACQGRHSISRIIQAASCPTHHGLLYRFLARARWSPTALSRILFSCCLSLLRLPDNLIVIVDDTLCKKSGPHIFGGGMHHDACRSSYAKRSTQASKTFAFGHNWVVLALWVPVPWNPHRGIAIPIAFRLYRPKKRCPKDLYRKRTELADELISLLLSWLPAEKTLTVVSDSEYACKTLLHKKPLPFSFVGTMAMNAALYDLPIQPTGRGRKRLRGKRLPSPRAMADNSASRWSPISVTLYGKTTSILVKSQPCLWYTVTGTALIRMIVTRDPKGRIEDRAYFCTDANLPIEQVLQRFACRWEIEVVFRNAKQFMGLEDPQNGWWRRSHKEPVAPKTPGPNPHPVKGQTTILHTFSMALTAYAIVLLWYFQHGNIEKDIDRVLAEAPWYLQKESPSFMDMIASLRREIWSCRINPTPLQNRDLIKFIDAVPHWLLAAA
jgi:hypothetical protein